MARPNWEWIKLDVLMPEHPKIESLSDKAFRALVELWCYCGRNRNDGIVTDKRWRQLPPKVRAELASAGLVDPIDIGGGCVMHDFTGPAGHQRSRQEIEEASDARSEKARTAAKARWGPRPALLPDAQSHAPSMLASIGQAHAWRCQRQWQRQRQRVSGPVQISGCAQLR